MQTEQPSKVVGLKKAKSEDGTNQQCFKNVECIVKADECWLCMARLIFRQGREGGNEEE